MPIVLLHACAVISGMLIDILLINDGQSTSYSFMKMSL